MPMPQISYNKLLQKLLGQSEKELPVVEQAIIKAEKEASGVPATIVKEGEVLGDGSSKPINQEPPILDVQAEGPYPKNLSQDPNFNSGMADDIIPEGKSVNLDDVAQNDLQKKYQMYKDLGKVGAAGIGATVAVNALNNSGGQLPPQASTAPKVPDAIPAAPAAPIAEPESEYIKELERQRNALLASINKQPVDQGPAIIDFGQGSIANLDQLKAIQEKMNEAQQINNFARIGAAAAASMGGNRNEFDPILADRAKQIEGMVGQYKDQVAFEEEDPNSPQSQGYRQLAKYMGFDPRGQASAKDLNKMITGPMSNIYTQKQAAELKRELAKEQAKAMSLKLAETKDLKTNLENNKFIERASEKLMKGTAAFNKIKKASAMIDEAVRNPTGVGDMTALYSLISALDPASTVREGEVGLARSAGGLIGKLEIGLSQLTKNPKLINQKSLYDIRTAIKQLESLNDQEYNAMKQHHLLQAKSRGIPESRYNEIDPYYKPVQYTVPKVAPLDKKSGKAPAPAAPSNIQSSAPVGRSGLTPEQRRARILELQNKKGNP